MTIRPKGLGLAAIATMAFVVSGGSAWAASGGATKETTPVSFSLSSATCPNLPPGTTVHGSGPEISITVNQVRGGVTTTINTTHANGEAIDQDGNGYVFNYSNHFRASNTLAAPDQFA